MGGVFVTNAPEEDFVSRFCAFLVRTKAIIRPLYADRPTVHHLETTQNFAV